MSLENILPRERSQTQDITVSTYRKCPEQANLQVLKAGLVARVGGGGNGE
jgi:hypothetical protein